MKNKTTLSLAIIILLSMFSCNTNNSNAVKDEINIEDDSLTYYTNEANMLEENENSLFENIPTISENIIKLSNHDTSSISLNSIEYGSEILKTISKISSEELPYIELPDFNECENTIIGKIDITPFYMLVIKSIGTNYYKTITGVIFDENGTIKNKCLLAATSGGSGASSTMYSDITELSENRINQIKINSSWDAKSEFTSADTTKMTIELTYHENLVKISYQE